ncbi:hypothetical protein BY458DRAFT_512664 [Sporodiniella umbellata]|nr:hypothetical protein BY458DRAFT_512664 [Sporodiniella umbellata]
MSTNVINNNGNVHLYQKTKKQKDADIDNSVYELLSMYLAADNLDLPQPKRSHQSAAPLALFSSGWLGEGTFDIVRQNTLKNSKTPQFEARPTPSKTKTRRSKSVSFNDTVTVIQDNLREEEEHFFDAPEAITA